jgi:hypothetical protein
MRFHILECESQYDRGGNFLENSSPTPPPNEPTGGEREYSLAHLERRCQDLHSENATLKRELDYQHAKTEQILENMERQVERLQVLLVGMGHNMGMNTRSMGKRSERVGGWARVGSIAAPIFVCVIVAAALALPASPSPWRYWNKGDTDGDRDSGAGGGGGLECTLAPAPSQPPIDAEEAAARLAQRAADLSAALTNAFQGGSEQGSSAEAEQREAARCGIARHIIQEALLERESQLINGTRDRAAALHFAGDPKNRDRILRNFGRMTHAIERFVLRDAGLGGYAALHIDEGAWNNARDRVAAHVSLHRQSVIVFHDADKANPERLSGVFPNRICCSILLQASVSRLWCLRSIAVSLSRPSSCEPFDLFSAH